MSSSKNNVCMMFESLKSSIFIIGYSLIQCLFYRHVNTCYTCGLFQKILPLLSTFSRGIYPKYFNVNPPLTNRMFLELEIFYIFCHPCVYITCVINYNSFLICYAVISHYINLNHTPIVKNSLIRERVTSHATLFEQRILNKW